MSTLTAPTVPVETREHYLNADYGIRSWLLTVDHKRIALLYLASITLFFFLGGFFAVLIRLELLTPQGDMVQAGLIFGPPQAIAGRGESEPFRRLEFHFQPLVQTSNEMVEPHPDWRTPAM